MSAVTVLRVNSILVKAWFIVYLGFYVAFNTVQVICLEMRVKSDFLKLGFYYLHQGGCCFCVIISLSFCVHAYSKLIKKYYF